MHPSKLPARRPCFLALALAFALPSVANAQTVIVLDDYSAPFSGENYVQKSGRGSWINFQGRLHAQTGGAGNYSAYAWTQHTLQDVGDAFSIDLLIAPVNNGQNGGLAVWTSDAAGTNPAIDRLFEPRLSYTGSGYELTSETDTPFGYTISALSGSPQGVSTLTITVVGRTETTTTLNALLTGAGFSALSHDYTFAFVDPLYVGPSSWQGNAGNVVFDNFSFASASAIPEPSTYAALAGAAALGLAVWRRRRAATSAVTTN